MWFRVDDGFTDHPKLAKAADVLGGAFAFDRVMAVWLEAGIYSARNLTDGFIPNRVVDRFQCRKATQVFQALCTAGLVDQIPDGFSLHDWHDYQPSAEEIKEKRKRDRDRKRGGFHSDSTRIPDGIVEDSAAIPSPPSRPVPSRPFPVVQERAETTALTTNNHAKRTNLINGADVRRHGQHAWCDPDRSLCVPYGLHDEFRKRGMKSDVELRQWYASIVASFNGRPVGDDVFTFWKSAFAQWVGTVAVKPTTQSTKASRTVESMKRVLQRRGEL